MIGQLRLLTVALVATLGSQPGLAKYNRLDRYLTEHVGDDNVNANLVAAEAWLSKGRALTPTGEVKQFLALKEIIGNEKCDARSHEITANNVRDTNLLQSMEDYKELRRVNRVVQSVFLEQAKTCQTVLVAKYRQKLQDLDRTQINAAQVFAKNLIDQTLFEMNLWDYKEPEAATLFAQFIESKITIKGLLGHERSPRRALMDLIGREPDGRYLSPDGRTGRQSVDRVKLVALVENHLIAPCRHYVAEFGPDVFELAELYKTAFRVKKTDRDFYFGWASFKICNLYLREKYNIANDLIQAIENPTSSKYN